MATSLPLENHINDKGPGTSCLSFLSSEDQLILQQPYAETLAGFGYGQEWIIHGVKSLQKKDRSVELKGITIMQEIDELQSKGWNPPPPQVKNLPKNDDIGSDGESEGASMEYYDANGDPPPPATNDDDLQTDAAPLAMSEMTPGPSKLTLDVPSPKLKPKVEKPIIDAHTTKDITALRRKLHALRSENRRLKERQLCKSCHTRPVSITFLPCGHYSYCYDCGQRFSACPICRKTILADVRTFLA